MCQLLCERFPLYYVVEEFTALHQLHDHTVVALVFEDGVELDDVGVVNFLHDLNFSLHGQIFIYAHFGSIQD